MIRPTPVATDINPRTAARGPHSPTTKRIRSLRAADAFRDFRI